MLEKCEGCGELPFDVAPPQAKGKSKFQCPAYARKDRKMITNRCWGMMSPITTFDAVNIWNRGEKLYRREREMTPREGAL